MKAFQFTMQTLLDHRENLKDLAQQEWAAAQSLLRELEEQLNLFREELLHSMGNSELLQGESYFQKQAYASIVRDRIGQQQEMIVKQKEEVELKQAKLQLCIQNCKGLEILREKQLEEYKNRQKKAELAFVDELNSQAYFRQNGQNL